MSVLVKILVTWKLLPGNTGSAFVVLLYETVNLCINCMLCFLAASDNILWARLLVLNLLLYTLLSLFNSFSLSLSLSSGLEVDECQINPNICGQGICYNTAEGYTCHCDEGYPLDDSQTTCVGEESSGRTLLSSKVVVLCSRRSQLVASFVRRELACLFFPKIHSIRDLRHAQITVCPTSNRA